MLAKGHHRHLVWLCLVLPHDRVCHAQNTSHDDKQPPRFSINMSEKPAWRLDLGLEALAHGSIICAFLHDITREARHFSTLTNGLLTVLDNPPKKDTLPFFRAWQFMPLAFETSALYAFRSRTFEHICIARVGNTQLCVHRKEHLACTDRRKVPDEKN